MRILSAIATQSRSFRTEHEVHSFLCESGFMIAKIPL